MGKKRHTVEQIVGKRREAEVQVGRNSSIGSVYRSLLGIPEQRKYR